MNTGFGYSAPVIRPVFLAGAPRSAMKEAGFSRLHRVPGVIGFTSDLATHNQI